MFQLLQSRCPPPYPQQTQRCQTNNVGDLNDETTNTTIIEVGMLIAITTTVRNDLKIVATR